MNFSIQVLNVLYTVGGGDLEYTLYFLFVVGVL